MSSEIRKHRLLNWVRSAGLLAASLSTMALTGYLLYGTLGVLVALFAVSALMLFTSPPPAERMLESRGARPLHAPWLESAVESLSARAGLATPPRLYALPLPVPQALAADDGRRPVIGVSPSLLSMLSPREVIGVVAHEMSHLESGDLGWMRMAEIVRRVTRTASSLGFFLLLFNLPLMLLTGAHVPWVGVLVLMVAPYLVNLLTLALSRAREYDADAGAVALTGDPIALASALRKIEAASTPSWWAWLGLRPAERWQSHPHTERRVARLVSMAKGVTPRPARRPRVVERGGRRVVTPEWRRVAPRGF